MRSAIFENSTRGHSSLMRIRTAALIGGLLALGACKETAIGDLNSPSQSDYEVIRSLGQLQAQATGLIDADRGLHGTQILYFETIGRDALRIDPAESRYITRLLGTSLSNSDFIGNSNWAGPYRVIRTAQVLYDAVKTPQLGPGESLSAQQISATRGYAQTIKGLEYMRIFEARERRGVAINVNDKTIQPLKCPPEVLAFVAAVLDSAVTDLRAAGTTAFPFALPSGFTGFTNAASFKKFTFGLRAKVEMYRGYEPLRSTDNVLATPDAALLTNALAFVDSSFYTSTSSRAGLDFGVYHVYKTGSGETPNPLVDVNVFRANKKIVTQDTAIVTYKVGTTTVTDTIIGQKAEVGDLRIQAKIDTASSNVTKTSSAGGRIVSSNYLFKYPASPTDKLALLKNEELVLVRAEILWGLGRYAEALTEVNNVRAAAGLPPKTAVDFAAFATNRGKISFLLEILREKRYSLFLESDSRLVDYRMLGILNTLGKERGNNPLRNFPIPSAEATARYNQLVTCS